MNTIYLYYKIVKQQTMYSLNMMIVDNIGGANEKFGLRVIHCLK
jgi:hypothetical protein